MAAIAVGRRTEPDVLPETIAAKDVPSDRKSRQEVAREGGF